MTLPAERFLTLPGRLVLRRWTSSSEGGHRHRTLPTLAMTPMIDVVFLLIIFFMCSQFRTLEGELLAMLPPRAGVVPGAKPLPSVRAPTARIYISRKGEGATYLLDGVPLPERGDLLPALLDLKRTRPRLEVVLDGDDDLPFEHFLFAFDVCLQAGIERINIVRSRLSPTGE